ncbi:MAG: hypothetical protein ABI222_16170, partial [Opitutaceae bacterium]
LPPGYALAGAVLVMAGCASSQTARIQEKSAVFQDLTPKEQKQILAGKVKVGFTTDMVYLSLGKPSVVNNINEPGAVTQEWVYNRYVSDSPRLVTGVVTTIPTYLPNLFQPTRAAPGATETRAHEDNIGASTDVVYTLQIRFQFGKVVWMKLT